MCAQQRSSGVESTDVLIVGGGLGGVAAALAAARHGARVVLAEPTDWLGGQLTNQAAPLDEHRWIESLGASRSYRRLRTSIRDLVRATYPLTDSARGDAALNPGLGWVSPLCVEPRIAHAAIETMITDAAVAPRLSVLRGVTACAADVHGDVVSSVDLVNHAGQHLVVDAAVVLDATEEGDLLPLVGAEFVTGSESSRDTGEPSAPRVPRPDNVQAITHAFAMEHRPTAPAVIARPDDYDGWRSFVPARWPGPLLGWTFPDPRTRRPVTLPFTPNPVEPVVGRSHAGDEPDDRDLWRYRRVVARAHAIGGLQSDVTIVNWPMNDYFEGPVTEVPDALREWRLQRARSLSASLLYWLQTEAPRPDGGAGWPGLRLRGDVVGSADGYARAPYIREARRIQARTTVREQDVARAVRGAHGAVRYRESVGIGLYRIDLHPTTGGDGYLDVETCPFEIPLGALLPVRLSNVLAAARNIGSTHITNGCYRVHPVEWSVGEAAGTLAAVCVATDLPPAAILERPAALEAYQDRLVGDGVELHWPDDVR